jgi:dipeptidase E
MPRLMFYSVQQHPLSDPLDAELLGLFSSAKPSVGYLAASGSADYGGFKESQEYYAGMGVQLEVYCELDNRFYPEILDALWACDGIHLAAGNAFHLLYWLQARNLLPALKDFATRGKVLIGVGSSAILFTPDIAPAALCGNEPVDPEMDLSALRLVDFTFIPGLEAVPHGLAAVKEYSIAHHRVIIGCRSGSGLAVKDDELIAVGEMVRIENGEINA